MFNRNKQIKAETNWLHNYIHMNTNRIRTDVRIAESIISCIEISVDTIKFCSDHIEDYEVKDDLRWITNDLERLKNVFEWINQETNEVRYDNRRLKHYTK